MKKLISTLARDPSENHRVSTPFELFFDLVYVVAISAAAVGLHHQLSEHYVLNGIIRYFYSFFAIWWPWMNFTWYASAYDDNSFAYRIITFIQIFGVLVLAVGIKSYFEPNHHNSISLAGYVIMLFAMVFHWVRAGYFTPKDRAACYRYAAGITIVQIWWVLNYFFGNPGYVVPVTVFLATTISYLITTDSDWRDIFFLGLGASVLIFSLWWSYFRMPFGTILHQIKTSIFTSFIFGYGHYFVFTSLAAVGCGLEVMSDLAAHSAHSVSENFALMCVATPVSFYLVMMSLYRTLLIRKSRYNSLSWLVAIILSFILVFFLYFGMPMKVALLLEVCAPAAFIWLNSADDCTNENAHNFELNNH